MGLLQPYSGKYVSAKLASNEIDAATIIAGCDAVDSEAEGISKINSKVSQAGSLITADALSIDDITVSENLNSCCEGINDVREDILSITSQIREMVTDAYNKLQSQYNEEAKAKDQMAIKEHYKNNN